MFLPVTVFEPKKNNRMLNLFKTYRIYPCEPFEKEEVRRMTSGHNRDFDLTYLRENIGVVTQDTYLFNGTILDNLRYAKENATLEEIEEACKIANIHDFIINQEDGYNTKVGNRGLKLSGGEKQRISIARVILKNPKILILDEATSALDSISESSIQNALENMMEGRTSIVIAHRLSTILKANKILVVKDGVIKESGTHEELLSKNGIYSELYETQFREAFDYEELKDKDTFDLSMLSSQYEVRKIKESDIEDVYRLSKLNRKYYRSIKMEPTRRNLTEVITDIPAGAKEKSKHFVGFYEKETKNENEKLVAILDLITGYKEENDVWIGWFMVDAEMQGQGIGSQIFADIRAAMKGQGFSYIRLGVVKGNIDALEFWKSQGFSILEEKIDRDDREVIIMGRAM